MASLSLCCITILPRTHVWCSGRLSAVLFGIPSLRSPQFSLRVQLFRKTSLPREFDALSLSLTLSLFPFSPLCFRDSSIHRISHVLTRLSDTLDCVEVRRTKTCRLKTLRAQRHPMAASPNWPCQGGHAVQLFGSKLWGSKAITSYL